MFRFLSASMLALSAVLVAGCGGGSFSGVQAQAPAIQQDLAGTVQSSGEYTLYRGTGYIEGFDQHVEPLWTISLQQGQKVGFRWVVDEAHKYDPEGAFHLVAFAGSDVRDLGSFRKRDMKYAWAGSHADAAGFFGSAGPRYAMEAAGIEQPESPRKSIWRGTRCRLYHRRLTIWQEAKRMNRLALLLAFAISSTAFAQSETAKPQQHLNLEQRSGLQWNHLSTATHDVELPGPSTEQTGAVVADLDKSGHNGFIVSFRKTAPALVWYRPNGNAWDRYVLDPSYLTVEAGGVVADVDGDGYPDIIFGADWQGDEVWWWENPGGKYEPNVPWKRHIIKKGGGHQHHDQAIADFEGTGKPQLVFWNQGAKKLLIASIPENPRTADQWDIKEVFSGSAGEGPGKYAEGVIALDVDGDGKPDIVAGNYWFKYEGDGKFKPTRIGTIGGRLAGGKLIAGSKYPQIVINSGDGVGPLKWYECVGDPGNSESWVGHDLAGRDVIHGHSLQIADIDGDGNLDIFAAEMAKWTEKRPDSDNPDATAWIFYGDGHGHFRKTVFSKGIEFHEARVADLNGDGRMDILDKPYNWETPRLDIWLQAPPAMVKPVQLSTAADEAKQKINVGLQLYSLRAQFPKDVPGTMKKIHDMGIDDVEAAGFYGLSAEEFKKDLDAAGLHPSGAHFQWPDFSLNIDKVIKDAKTLGVEYVTMPWIPHSGRFTEQNAHDAAMKFNEWGRKCKEAGLKFAYHPHGYEFTKNKNAEGTVFDQLVKETDPNYVNFELDIFWAYHGGADPVKLMQQYPTRFVQMHVKDMNKSVKVPKNTGSENVENDVAMGTGQLDIPAILKEAQQIGITHYYIEDESSRSLDQIPASIAYVRSIGY